MHLRADEELKALHKCRRNMFRPRPESVSVENNWITVNVSVKRPTSALTGPVRCPPTWTYQTPRCSHTLCMASRTFTPLVCVHSYISAHTEERCAHTAYLAVGLQTGMFKYTRATVCSVLTPGTGRVCLSRTYSGLKVPHQRTNRLLRNPDLKQVVSVWVADVQVSV